MRRVWFSLALTWAAVAQGENLDGSWRGEFDGLSLQVEGRAVSVYESSSSGRFFVSALTLDPEDRYTTSDGRVFHLRVEDGRLRFYTDRGHLFLSFEPVESLPPLITQSDDPLLAFDVFWEAFNENYALFDLTGTDWSQLRDTWRPSAGQADGDALFALFSDMLAPLNDVHTTVTRSDTLQTFRSGADRDPFWDGRHNLFLTNLASQYLGAPLQTRFGDGRLRFGVLPGNVGYLAVIDFLDSGFGLSIGATLDAILGELAGVDGLIIDLRFNPGGSEQNTLAFLERVLSPDNRLVYVRETRRSAPPPEAFYTPQVLDVADTQTPIQHRPVAVLTSHNTASGAEGVLLPMLREPWFAQVGETTRGVFSKLLFRHLPNGWLVTLSNERYYSLGGVSYEQAGLAPVIPVSQAAYDLEAGRDAAVNAALEWIAAAPAPVQTGFDPGTGISGLWFDPERDGEGWHIQRVRDDLIFVSFYTYPATGSATAEWFVGVGRSVGDEVVIERLFTTTGGYWGAGPDDASMIEEVEWGHGRLRFRDCDNAVAEIAGPDDYRGFVFRLRRLTRIPGLECSPEAAADPETAVFTGSWYVAKRPGEGWLVSHDERGQAVVSWYTFTPQGQRRWLIGPGVAGPGGSLVVDTMFEGSGTRFGFGFDAKDVATRAVGTLEFVLDGCHAGQVRFRSGVPGESELAFAVERLLGIEGVDYGPGCTD